MSKQSEEKSDHSVQQWKDHGKVNTVFFISPDNPKELYGAEVEINKAKWCLVIKEKCVHVWLKQIPAIWLGVVASITVNCAALQTGCHIIRDFSERQEEELSGVIATRDFECNKSLRIRLEVRILQVHYKSSDLICWMSAGKMWKLKGDKTFEWVIDEDAKQMMKDCPEKSFISPLFKKLWYMLIIPEKGLLTWSMCDFPKLAKPLNIRAEISCNELKSMHLKYHNFTWESHQCGIRFKKKEWENFQEASCATITLRLKVIQ